jgi:hypothetical protein
MLCGQLSFWANVYPGKCLSGQMPFWSNVSGQMSFWANVFLMICDTFYDTLITIHTDNMTMINKIDVTHSYTMHVTLQHVYDTRSL